MCICVLKRKSWLRFILVSVVWMDSHFILSDTTMFELLTYRRESKRNSQQKINSFFFNVTGTFRKEMKSTAKLSQAYLLSIYSFIQFTSLQIFLVTVCGTNTFYHSTQNDLTTINTDWIRDDAPSIKCLFLHTNRHSYWRLCKIISKSIVNETARGPILLFVLSLNQF